MKYIDKKQTLILIVDDLPQNLQVLGSILRKAGYQLAVSTNGKQVMSMMDKISPDLILLDVMMPEMNGHEVCQWLKKNEKTNHIPVIFLTAKTETEDIVKGFELGAVDYITKPFNSTELLARVKTHIELKKNRDVILKLITELEQKNKILEELAVTDGLTKIYNHKHIIDRLTSEINGSKRHGNSLSIIMFDIDYFKNINDTYGHPFGDKVLVKVSNTIKEELRSIDEIGRYGGEEFLVILRNTDKEGSFIAADRIRESIELITWDVDGFKVTISGGICTLDNENASELIMKADQGLYSAKKKGRNRIEYDPG